MIESISVQENQFRLSEHHSLIFEQANKFAKKELYPLASRMDADEWWPEEIFRKIGSEGFCGITIPEEFGGQGLDILASGLIAQAMGRWNYAMALSWIAHENLCLDNLYRNSNDEQKIRYLHALCSGQHIGALGLTEPGAGSDALGAMSTTADRQGDVFILNGRKMYITNGPVADVLLVYAKTAKDLGKKGISAFIVEKEFPGFSVAQKLMKMGFRGSQTGELVFDNVKVPKENIFPNKDGLGAPLGCLDKARYGISWGAIGVALDCYDAAKKYSIERHQFDKPIASFQLIQKKLAEMLTEITKAQLLCWRLGSLMDKGKVSSAQISLAKRNNVEIALKIAREARQIHGGMGITNDYPMMRHMMNLESVITYEGTHDIHLLILGHDITGIPAFS